MATIATRNSVRRVRWAGIGGVLTNRRPGLARRSATLTTGRGARKSAAPAATAEMLGTRFRLRRQDDRDVLEVALRQRGFARAPKLIGQRRIDLLRYVEWQRRLFGILTP